MEAMTRHLYLKPGMLLSWIALAPALLASLAGCSYPALLATIVPTLVVNTQASLISATQPGTGVTRELPPIASSQPPASPSKTPAPPVVVSPSKSPVSASMAPLALTVAAIPCDRAAPGNPAIDITVPDDTHFEPGQSFSKTWRLRNDGTCTWNNSYALVWFSGDPLDARLTNNLSENVLPGQNIDITIDLTAPEKPGIYQSNWKLSNKAGELFGIGPNGDAPIWVRIIVEQPNTDTPQPTITPTPTVSTVVAGMTNLKPGESLDLDTNQPGQTQADDLLYALTGDKQHQLVPQNGASLALNQLSQPSIADCQNAALSTDPIDLDGLTIGTYFCYRTNNALPGWARLVLLDPQDDTLSLEILTWTAP
jgi:hypothetical protein